MKCTENNRGIFFLCAPHALQNDKALHVNSIIKSEQNRKDKRLQK